MKIRRQVVKWLDIDDEKIRLPNKFMRFLSFFTILSLLILFFFFNFKFTLPAQNDQCKRGSVMIGEIGCVIQAGQSGENIKIAEMRKERESLKERKKTEAARERKRDSFNLAFEFLKSRKVGWGCFTYAFNFFYNGHLSIF